MDDQSSAPSAQWSPPSADVQLLAAQAAWLSHEIMLLKGRVMQLDAENRCLRQQQKASERALGELRDEVDKLCTQANSARTSQKQHFRYFF